MGLLWLLTLLVVGCASQGPATPAPATVRIAGSTSMGRALAELAAAYQAQHPNVLVDVRGGGSGAGLTELRRGGADLAAISWLSPDQAAPEDLRALPVGRDAVAVIVHSQNPAPNLTILQLRALYRGEVLDWMALGGPAEAPVLISREEGSGTRAAFEALVMGGDRVTLNALVMPTTQAVVDYVATHRSAIGYVSAAGLNAEGEETPQVRAVPVEGVSPTPVTLGSGAYPLGRTLYLYSDPTPAPAAQAFLDFMLSPLGQAIIAKYHTRWR